MAAFYVLIALTVDSLRLKVMNGAGFRINTPCFLLMPQNSEK